MKSEKPACPINLPTHPSLETSLASLFLAQSLILAVLPTET